MRSFINDLKAVTASTGKKMKPQSSKTHKKWIIDNYPNELPDNFAFMSITDIVAAQESDSGLLYVPSFMSMKQIARDQGITLQKRKRGKEPDPLPKKIATMVKDKAL